MYINIINFVLNKGKSFNYHHHALIQIYLGSIYTVQVHNNNNN